MKNSIFASNLVCQEQDSISITQPAMQSIPDDTQVGNPYFNMDSNISYWTYKLISLCDVTQFVIPLDIYIPIYSNVSQEMLTVDEEIISCGRFEEISFDFQSPNGVTPPLGFKYLHISFDNRFGRGNAVVFRLAILGNFPTAAESIYVNTNQSLLEFDANFLVPSEPLTPRLTVTKDGSLAINGETGIIEFNATVTNTGNTDLVDVQFLDTITYNAVDISIGTIVPPTGLTVNTSMPGIIEIAGSIGDLTMGASIELSYEVPLEGFSRPDTFIFNSVTKASSGAVLGFVNSQLAVPVVSMGTSVRCSTMDSDSGSFSFSISSIPMSPLTEIDIEGTISIPNGVVVRFSSFSNCTGTFPDGNPVPLNTNITDNSITLSCEATVPSSATMNYTITFDVIEISDIQSDIIFSLNRVELQAPNSQVYLGATPLPNQAELIISLEGNCNNNCIEI